MEWWNRLENVGEWRLSSDSTNILFICFNLFRLDEAEKNVKIWEVVCG